jgi:hypothetical protein
MFTQYLVTTRHGKYDMVSTLDEAKRLADWHMEGFEQGLRSSNDPMPKIQRVQYEMLHSYEYDKETHTYKDVWNDEGESDVQPS